MDPEKPIDTDQANAELRQMAEILRKARAEMEQFGFVTAETSKKLEEMQKQARYNEMWGKKWQIVAGGAATAAVELGSALYKGQTGALASAKALSTFTTTIGDAASTLSLLMPGGIIRKGLVFLGGQLLKIGGKLFEETAKVSDDLYEAFYKLRDVGAATETGMGGLSGRMLELNYGINEMDKTVALLRTNAQDLATFGGTVGEGSKAFGEFAYNLRKNNAQQYIALRRLYGSQDELNKRQAVYISLQTQLGQKTTVSINEFDRMTRATDALTKAFGVQTEELDKANKRNLQETAFRSFLQQMSAGGEEMKQRGNQIMNEVSTLQTKGYTKTAEGIKAALTEQYGSEDFKKLMLAAQQAGVDINQQVRDIKAGRQTVMGFATLLGKAGQRLQGTMSRIAQQTPEIFEETFGALPELLDLAAGGDLRARTEKGVKSTEEMAAGMDKAAEKALGLRIEQEKARNTLQSFIQDGITPATIALEGLARATNVLIGERIPKLAKSRQAEVEKVRGLEEGPVPQKMPKTGAAGMIGAAAKNLNPGNLRFAGQAGATEGTGGFAKFETVDEGLVALAKQLDLYLTGKSQMGKRDTIASIVSAYAPPNENETQVYIDQLAKFMGKKPDEVLTRDPATIAKLMVGIIGKESMGGVEKGYNMRGGIQAAVAQALGIDPSKVGKFQKGGISDGPESGYMAMLHGLEAIVPLANNRSIPVSFREPDLKNISPDISLGKDLPNINESINRQSQVLQQQLEKADAMLQVLERFASADQVQVMIDKLQTLSDKMNTSNDINSRILQVSM